MTGRPHFVTWHVYSAQHCPHLALRDLALAILHSLGPRSTNRGQRTCLQSDLIAGLTPSPAHTGVLRAVVWTLEPKSETQAAACNVYGLTLHVADDQSLTEADAHLLIKAKLPPHAVCCHAHPSLYTVSSHCRADTVELGFNVCECCLVFRWLSQLSWMLWPWRLTLWGLSPLLPT